MGSIVHGCKLMMLIVFVMELSTFRKVGRFMMARILSKDWISMIRIIGTIRLWSRNKLDSANSCVSYLIYV